MTKQINQLQKKIMRRVYYAFVTRMVTHTITMHVAVLGLALFIFAKMVHVRSVIHNLLETSVGNAPSFVMSAVMHGEVLTLMAIGVMMFILLSLPLQIKSQFMPRTQTV